MESAVRMTTSTPPRPTRSTHTAGSAAMLLMMWWLLPFLGMRGLAIARLCYGSFSLLLYLHLARTLVVDRRDVAPVSIAIREFEEASEV